MAASAATPAARKRAEVAPDELAQLIMPFLKGPDDIVYDDLFAGSRVQPELISKNRDLWNEIISTVKTTTFKKLVCKKAFEEILDAKKEGWKLSTSACIAWLQIMPERFRAQGSHLSSAAGKKPIPKWRDIFLLPCGGDAKTGEELEQEEAPAPLDSCWCLGDGDWRQGCNRHCGDDWREGGRGSPTGHAKGSQVRKRDRAGFSGL